MLVYNKKEKSHVKLHSYEVILMILLPAIDYKQSIMNAVNNSNFQDSSVSEPVYFLSCYSLVNQQTLLSIIQIIEPENCSPYIS